MHTQGETFSFLLSQIDATVLWRAPLPPGMVMGRTMKVTTVALGFEFWPTWQLTVLESYLRLRTQKKWICLASF